MCPLTPIGGRTGGRCNNREAFSPLRYWALNFTAEPLAAPRRDVLHANQAPAPL